MNNFMSSNNSRPEEMQLKSTSLSREHSAKIGINEDLWRSGLLGPIYMVSGTRDNPLPETTLQSVYMKFNVCWPSFGQVTYLTKWWTAGKKKSVNILVMACARIFRSSCLVSGRRDKVFTWGKVARLTPLVVSCTWEEFITSCKRLAEFFIKNKWRVSSPRVTWGEDCLWYPRPCKWGLIM